MPVQKKRPLRVGRAGAKNPKLVSISDRKFRVRFENAKRVWEGRLRSLAEGARSSERLSERDFAVRVNARG
jgi:hypothetical protein